jgi:uncharacterized protein involved in exopolysaccharide biosynthesis
MSLQEFFQMLGRWKRVVIPGVVLALAAGGLMFSLNGPTYSQTESYLLLSPVQTEAGPTNPFLTLGNGTSLTASVLAAKASDGETVRQVTADAPNLTYTVALDTSVAAPLIVVTVEDADEGQVVQALETLGQDLATTLNQLQRDSGAPETSWVTIRKFTADPEATASWSTPLRNGIAAVVAVGLLVLLLVALLERRRRRPRAAGRDAVSTTAGPVDEPVSDRGAGHTGAAADESAGARPAAGQDAETAGDEQDADAHSTPVRSGATSSWR